MQSAHPWGQRSAVKLRILLDRDSRAGLQCFDGFGQRAPEYIVRSKLGREDLAHFKQCFHEPR